MWVQFPLLAPMWSGGHVNLSTGWLETVYGCHAYPKKTPNTRGGDYQRRTESFKNEVKAGVLQPDTVTLSIVNTYR